jgi:hypothetical protein
MKVYDKEIYQKQESIKNTLIIIIVFLLGFFVGYISNSFTTAKAKTNNVNVNSVKIESVD